MKKNDFIKSLETLKIKYSKEMLDQIEIYLEFLMEYNSHTNLTAIRDEEGIYEKHFYDSLTLVNVVDLNNVNNLLDIGTGAGFPGLVIKIFFPKIKVTLLDSNNKKIKFLNELVNKLQLKDVEIINARAEDLFQRYHDSFDLVVSRSVAYIDIITSLSLPFIKKEKEVVLMKINSSEEEEIIKNNQKNLNISSYKVIKFDNKCFYLIKKESNKFLTYKEIIKNHDKLLKHS